VPSVIGSGRHFDRAPTQNDAESIFWQKSLVAGNRIPVFRVQRLHSLGSDITAYTPTNEEIAMARRHVLLGEGLVAQQQLLILQLKSRGHLDLTTQAQSVLDTLTISLALARADLSSFEKTSN